MRRALMLCAAGVLAASVSAFAWQASPLVKSGRPAAPALPASIQGLKVNQEDITKTVAEDRRPLYTDGVWLYSLRQGKELMATLEIGHLRAASPWQSSDFDLSLASQLGGSVPVVVRLDGEPVYLSTTRGLEMLAWFKSGYLNVLAVRSTYPEPKTLLRSAMEQAP